MKEDTSLYDEYKESLNKKKVPMLFYYTLGLILRSALLIITTIYNEDW